MLMAAAGLVAVVFSCLRWPKVIGYILAGILMSRHTWGGSFLVDESSVSTIGQIGIVFLMFSMGLGFSTTEMKRVGNSVMPVAIFDMAVMTWLGYTVARTCFGWGTVPALFLGAAVSDSATTLLAKVIDEMKWSSRPFVRLALGTSVCEDIMCVGLIALVTGVANGGTFSLAAVGKPLAGLCVFFISVFIFGLVILPKALSFVARRGDDEALLLFLLGCSFFITYISYQLEFSIAIGAFLVGVLGACSYVRERLARLVEPLRAMFASVFFVSVGLLVNPAECFSHGLSILALSALVVGGKFLNCTIGALACGESIKTSVQTGLALAQIGEFAYMTALLYVTVTGDMTKPMYQIVVGVSLLTTLANPFLIRLSDPAGEWAERACPKRVKSLIDGYRGFLARYRSRLSERGAGVRGAIRRQIAELLVLGVLAFAIAFAFSALSGKNWSYISVFFERYKRIFFSLAMNVLLFALVLPGVVKVAFSLSRDIAATIVGGEGERWQQAVYKAVRFTVTSIVLILAFIEIIMININLAPGDVWSRIAICVVLAVAAALGWRIFIKAARAASRNFSEALKTDERLAALSREVTLSLPVDSVTRLDIGADSPAVGMTVAALDIRAKTGASVFSVERGDVEIRNIGPGFEFSSGDVLTVVGDGAQVAALKDLLGITS